MRVLNIALVAFSVAVCARAQNAPGTFEVASVKRNLTNSGSSIGGMLIGDRFTATNVTLIQLLRNAYGVQEFQIAEHPGWAETERFDVEAKTAQLETDPTVWQPMLQNLLADRFKLALHRENRQSTSYELVVAKNGPKLTAADPSKCNPPTPGCQGFRASPVEIIGSGVSMEQLAMRLARSIGRMVADKTGLKGSYDLKLEWAREDPFTNPGASASAGIFAALQDQLGLRLESVKSPVETLIIDHAERPAEN